MKKQPKDTLMKRERILIFIIVVFVLIVTGGYYYYRYEENSIREVKYNDLQIIANLKISRITQWCKERSADIQVFAESPLIYKNMQHWLISNDNAIKTDLLKRLSLIRYHYNYENVFLLTPEGKLLLSIDTTLKDIDPVTAGFGKSAIKDRKALLSDFYYCPTHRTIHFDIIAPISNEKDAPLAVLVLRVNPYDYLYTMITSWPILSKTAEALIVRKDENDVLFLNELRRLKNTALKLRISLSRKEVMAVKAVLGHKGIYMGKDYRGVNVLADIRPVPDTPWFMVVKVDQSEIFSDLYYRASVIVIFVVMLMSFFGIGLAWLYSNRQKNIYKELLDKRTALQESQEEFRATLYSIGDAVITTDTNGCIRHMNPVAEQLTGWNETDAIGKGIAEVFYIINERTRSTVENPVQRVLKEGLVTGLANHTLLISKEGREIPIADSGAPIRNEKNNISGVVLVFRDQTAERAAQQTLTASEQRYYSTLENMMEGCQIIGFDWSYLFINASAARHGRRTKEELLGHTMMEMYPGIEKTPMFAMLKRCMKKRISHKMENEFTYPDGSKGWFELSIQPVSEGISILSHDITERKMAEEALHKSEEKYRLIADNANDWIYLITKNGNMLYTSPSCEKITGYTSSEFIEIAHLLQNIVHADDRNIIESHFESYNKQGEYHDLEFRVVAKDGDIHWLNHSCQPVVAADGTYIGRRGTNHDITARKHVEDALARRTLELDLANKELEQVLYATSHDLRSPLVNVQGFTKELEAAIQQLLAVLAEAKITANVQKQIIPILTKDIPESIQFILASTLKMDTLLSGLLRLSRIGREKLTVTKLDMNNIITDVLSTHKFQIKEKKVKLHVDHLPACRGDAAQINQVFSNLLDNAIKYLEENRKGKVSVSGKKDGKETVYCVEDNGIGIDNDHIDKIFEIFHQLDPAKKGTGLGLTIVKRILDNHNGSIKVQSQPGVGSKFFVSLPGI
jgi:PAS domain S-box-containing protein